MAARLTPRFDAMPEPIAADAEIRRTLERLYLRRDAIDGLIQDLEFYESQQRPAPCMPINARRRCA